MGVYIITGCSITRYKFFDPAINDDSAYLDDPEAREKIANPFGSFDYLIRWKQAISYYPSYSDNVKGKQKRRIKKN